MSGPCPRRPHQQNAGEALGLILKLQGDAGPHGDAHEQGWLVEPDRIHEHADVIGQGCKGHATAVEGHLVRAVGAQVGCDHVVPVEHCAIE